MIAGSVSSLFNAADTGHLTRTNKAYKKLCMPTETVCKNFLKNHGALYYHPWRL